MGVLFSIGGKLFPSEQGNTRAPCSADTYKNAQNEVL